MNTKTADAGPTAGSYHADANAICGSDSAAPRSSIVPGRAPDCVGEADAVSDARTAHGDAGVSGLYACTNPSDSALIRASPRRASPRAGEALSSAELRLPHGYVSRPPEARLEPDATPTQNCEMNFQASGGTNAFRPSSPPELPSAMADGVCAPSNVQTFTG